MNIDVLSWAKPLFDSSNRFCVLHGGRGAAKSEQVARVLIIRSLMEKHGILCGREFQDSISDSVYSLLERLIFRYGLQDYFNITQKEIRSLTTGSFFIFKGLRHNINSIKSIDGITIAWLEEAATISRNSWEILKPSIRGENSQIICTFNDRYEKDCMYQDFVLRKPSQQHYIKKVSWRDNPYFPAVLEAERQDLMKKDMGLYMHVWEGELLKNSESQIFNNRWVVDDFEIPDDVHMYYGLDFGTRDPTAAVACFIKDNTLYIAYEAGKSELDIDYIGEYCKQRIPNWGKEAVWADSSRPDTISFLKKQGYNIKPADKGKGSVEDGIAHIKSYDRVVIHSRCVKTIEEFTLYSYKVDERSGEITAKIVDAYNHYIDAIRYALNKVMKKKGMDYSAFDKYALYN